MLPFQLVEVQRLFIDASEADSDHSSRGRRRHTDTTSWAEIMFHVARVELVLREIVERALCPCEEALVSRVSVMPHRQPSKFAIVR